MTATQNKRKSQSSEQTKRKLNEDNMEKSYYNFDNLNVVNLYKWRKQGSNHDSLDLQID